MTRSTDPTPDGVSAGRLDRPRTRPDGQVRARWAWTEPTVWTDRMLTALEQGVQGGKWFRLMDKVYAAANLAAAYREVAANGGAAACGCAAEGRVSVRGGCGSAKLLRHDSACAVAGADSGEGGRHPCAVADRVVPHAGGHGRALRVDAGTWESPRSRDLALAVERVSRSARPSDGRAGLSDGPLRGRLCGVVSDAGRRRGGVGGGAGVGRRFWTDAAPREDEDRGGGRRGRGFPRLSLPGKEALASEAEHRAAEGRDPSQDSSDQRAQSG